SGRCAPAACATCATGRSAAPTARRSAPASTRLRDASRSSCRRRAVNPLHRLTEEQIEALGREFDQLHEDVKADLGDRDAAYIRGIISLHRRLGLIGRVVLCGARHKPAWVLGTATLSLAKILENMEIGHNVLHGQWDWMNDP